MITLAHMKDFLSKSLSSINENKLNGLKAEIDFRQELQRLGFSQRVSPGGWLYRNTHTSFGHHTIAVFPYVITPGQSFQNAQSQIPTHLHTICATFQQIGIRSYYALPRMSETEELTWSFVRLGVPHTTQPEQLSEITEGFRQRERRYNYLRYSSDVAGIPEAQVPEEFSKECLRVFMSTSIMAEVVDIDGIVWGEQFTYPVEIKEKTAAEDGGMGEYFGLDVGPFVKLAFYAAKRGNLNSLFVVREIHNVQDRRLRNWLFITFERLAQFASWKEVGGGTNMGGGRSTVVRIPKSEFTPLNAETLSRL